PGGVTGAVSEESEGRFPGLAAGDGVARIVGGVRAEVALRVPTLRVVHNGAGERFHEEAVLTRAVGAEDPDQGHQSSSSKRMPQASSSGLSSPMSSTSFTWRRTRSIGATFARTTSPTPRRAATAPRMAGTGRSGAKKT